jgi:dTDP-glucose 4,6-dehydratase
VYDEAKRLAEAVTTAYRTHHGVDAAIVRIFNTFGPRMRANDGQAAPTFIRQALTGVPLTVSGDGTQTRSVCYISDLVDGIERLMKSAQAGPMNLGNPHEVSVLDLALQVKRLAGSDSPIEFVPRPQDDPAIRRPDIQYAKQTLGWEPRVAPGEGLALTIDWFRIHGCKQAVVGRRVS